MTCDYPARQTDFEGCKTCKTFKNIFIIDMFVRVYSAKIGNLNRNEQGMIGPLQPSTMSEGEFVAAFKGVFEHSEWIARQAFRKGVGKACDTAGGLHDLMVGIFRTAGHNERLNVLNAHPDLAGRLAAARRLTPESASEQASAGLDALTDKERDRFTRLNEAYSAKHGFPFIIAVKGVDKKTILDEFERRINNDRIVEFDTACKQVERIALLRLQDMLPEDKH